MEGWGNCDDPHTLVRVTKEGAVSVWKSPLKKPRGGSGGRKAGRVVLGAAVSASGEGDVDGGGAMGLQRGLDARLNRLATNELRARVERLGAMARGDRPPPEIAARQRGLGRGADGAAEIAGSSSMLTLHDPGPRPAWGYRQPTGPTSRFMRNQANMMAQTGLSHAAAHNILNPGCLYPRTAESRLIQGGLTTATAGCR